MARHFSNEPDAPTLVLLQKIELVALIIPAVIAVIIMALWVHPGLDRFAPPFWFKMTANTAFATFLAVGALELSIRHNSGFRRKLGMALAALGLVLAMLVLLEYAANISIGFDTLLPHRPNMPYPGRPTQQAAFAFALANLCTLCLRQSKNFWSRAADFTALAFLALNFTLLGGIFFGLIDHISIYNRIVMSPQTLIILFSLNTVILVRRAEQGDWLAVLVNIGIGSRMVRLILPGALLLPFALLAAAHVLVQSGALTVVYAQSVLAALVAVMLLCVLALSGWQINALERDLRDMSLTDELTDVFNRRGFYFLGQQAIREAQRANTSLSLYFFDLDGLKRVNDQLGHEAGSDLIRSFAGVLRDTFRKSDIVGRVGGDEFAVITIRDEARWIDSINKRLRGLTDTLNEVPGRAYRLSFSTGYAELTPGHADTLDSLVTRADGLMYKDKERRKIAA